MKKGLVIVESPTKVRTLKKYLGSAFDVRASVGHIKDLPKSKLGVEIEKDFQPKYETIKGKAKVIKELKDAASSVEDVYLAPDPDREGEAIAWHIRDELKPPKNKALRFHRVMFRELTEKAIKEAMAAPVELNEHRFASQQARRILDRLVGYQISPILWQKVKPGLSAGRVQSVAVKLICDREKEIKAFVPEEYWTVEAELKKQGGAKQPSFLAKVIQHKGKKLSMSNEVDAKKVVDDLQSAEYLIKKIQKKERLRNPAAPFITSTLQQEAARKLRFSAKKTMMIAQRLYEGIELGDEGPVGLITYMRTDSTRVAQEASDAATAFILERFGKEFLPAKKAQYKKAAQAQDAHEAIRPSSVLRRPEDMKAFLEKDAFLLYELIWKRFLASQMAPAILDQTQVDIAANDYLLRANGSVIRFPGFMTLYIEQTDEDDKGEKLDEADVKLPALEENEALLLKKLLPKQHFTQPPPRYSEASLIKTLEEKGIGRPSTYAAIMANIIDREYVSLVQRYFVPTDLGMLVTELLSGHFADIVNTEFTASMEKQLDEIEDGSANWVEVLKKFYASFQTQLETAKETMQSIKRTGIATDLTCDKCGAPMVIKYGKSGEFLACSGYPECKNAKDFERDPAGNIKIREKQETPTDAEPCEKCGSPMVLKRGRYGEFLACSGYPKCKNIRSITSGIPCPEPGCTGTLTKRRTKAGRFFYGCNKYPDCTYATWNEPVNEKCESCGFGILVVKKDKDGVEFLACPQKGCGFKKSRESQGETGS